MSNFIKFKDNAPEKLTDNWNTMIDEVVSSYFLPPEKQKVCVDIGSNIGAFMGYALQEERFEKIYGFEPAFQTYHTSLTMLKHFKLIREDVQVRNLAVTEKTGQLLRLFGHESNESGNTSLIPPENPSGEEVCISVGLDDIFEIIGADYIDYLKMDCEGAELNILHGCKRIQDIGFISAEVHHGMMEDVRNFFKANGFWSMNFQSPDDEAEGDMIFAVNVLKQDMDQFKQYYGYDEFGKKKTIEELEKLAVEAGVQPLNIKEYKDELLERLGEAD
jgi:FkbM family methyltransferase